MIILDVDQGSPEWDAARLGIPTASNFDNIITSKGEPSKQATEYMYKLAVERITGKKIDGFKSDAMQRGNDLEADAVRFYELSRNVETTKVGFVYKDELKKFGASPDRLIGTDGLAEIKCPLAHTHVEYLLEKKMPTKYVVQVQGQMYVTDAKWTDFISYFPAMPPFIIRVMRDDALIGRLEMELIRFCRDLDALVERLKSA
jgi:putative phage-type endonuclease